MTVANLRPPVVVGGIGGSGTRLVARILNSYGYFLGSDMNDSLDNLWFTLLFKRLEILSCSSDEYADLCDIFRRVMTGYGLSLEQRERIRYLAVTGREEHDVTWLQARVNTLLAHQAYLAVDQPWGWKEPNTHIVLEHLIDQFPGMRYIFLSRHGLDMALSGNQNQPRMWGASLMGEPYSDTPRYLLRYWCFVHRRVQNIGATMGDRFLFLKYDDVCLHKETSLAQLNAFLGLDDDASAKIMPNLVSPSPSIGRYRFRSREEFNKDDIAYVESLGYEVCFCG
jgi:hypothetical protein